MSRPSHLTDHHISDQPYHYGVIIKEFTDILQLWYDGAKSYTPNATSEEQFFVETAIGRALSAMKPAP